MNKFYRDLLTDKFCTTHSFGDDAYCISDVVDDSIIGVVDFDELMEVSEPVANLLTVLYK